MPLGGCHEYCHMGEPSNHWSVLEIVAEQGLCSIGSIYILLVVTLECVDWLVLLGWPHKPSQLPTDCNVSHWDLIVTIKKTLVLNTQVTLSGKAKAPCPLSNTDLPWDFSDTWFLGREHQLKSGPIRLPLPQLYFWLLVFLCHSQCPFMERSGKGGHVERRYLKIPATPEPEDARDMSMELQVFKDSMLFQLGITEHLLY